MKRSIVVTGAAGFIGSCVVRELNERGRNDLILVDHLGCSKKWSNLVGKNFDELLHKDQALSWLATHSRQVEAVIHLGACSSTTESDADYLLSNNTHYSQRLAQMAIEHRWRFIYASSAATYGDGSQGFEDRIEDLERLRPLNMYGYSKQLFDLWLKRRGWLDQCVGLKYFNVFGPNEWHKGAMSSHVLKMFSQVQQGQVQLFRSNDPRYRDGGQMRDFIYVKDVARMTCDLLDSSLTGLFNIGSGKAHSWQELAQALMAAVGKVVTIDYIEMPSALKGQYQNYTCAAMERWQQSGMIPARWSLQQGVKDYVDHHLLTGQSW